MSSQSDNAAEEALLMELAQLGMGLARQLHQAALATTDAVPLLALATAYTKVSRGVRQSLALRARFAAGTVAPERTTRAETAPSASTPRPEAKGEGSTAATTTRLTPASIRKFEQEVRPEDRAPQGSMVT